MDRENDGALPEALAALTGVLDRHAEELEEIETLIADGVRLAVQIGDLSTAQAIARHAASLATASPIPHHQAGELYCRGLLDHEASLLLAAAELYRDASRPLKRAKALEAAAREFISTGELRPARAAFNQAVETYKALGATADVARLQAVFRAHGIRRGPHASTATRTAAGPASRQPRSRSPRS